MEHHRVREWIHLLIPMTPQGRIFNPASWARKHPSPCSPAPLQLFMWNLKCLTPFSSMMRRTRMKMRPLCRLEMHQHPNRQSRQLKCPSLFHFHHRYLSHLLILYRHYLPISTRMFLRPLQIVNRMTTKHRTCIFLDLLFLPCSYPSRMYAVLYLPII